MTIKDRYNRIIARIEELVTTTEFDARRIADEVSREQTLSTRDMSIVLNFFVQSPAISYIKERKMMAAYRYLIEAEEPYISEAVAISGLDNQSSFTKKFSSTFGHTPQQAIRLKDASCILEPPYWDQLSQATPQPATPRTTEDRSMQTIYGIDKEAFERAAQAQTLQALYGFSDTISQLAFNLADHYKVSLETSYAFLDNIRSFVEEMDSKPNPLESLRPAQEGERHRDKREEEQIMERFARSTYFRRMYFENGLSVEVANFADARIPLGEKEILKLDPDYIIMFYLYPDMTYDYFDRAYKYYQTHITNTEEYTDVQLDEYFGNINIGMDYHRAFAAVEPEFTITAEEMDYYMEHEEQDYEDAWFDAMEEERNNWM